MSSRVSDMTVEELAELIRRVVREELDQAPETVAMEPVPSKQKDPFRGVRHIPPRPPKHPNHRVRYRDPGTGRDREYVLTPEEAQNIEAVRGRIWNELRNAHEVR